ncbi:something about silencing protein 10 [Didymosphaeria variabile]|uniref:Something about silencing protein 10 n=1 Tax=Didymosphaeria variabile TaxID=1932322 RepID=A0A9W9CB92_9PLEO|nr:something about silencing protein 10 [Didymosphaeria variabile]KAJ4354531.1 something about silencing protein 10 [Didymosphaeria variabile]
MGKKRKAGGRYGEPTEPKEENSKLAISTYEDVADSEDEFHINRDKILLDDGPAAKKLRKWREEDELLQPEDEEILDYDEDDDEDGFDEEQYEEDAEADEDDTRKPEAEDEEDLGGWGPSKKDYYNADAIETEQDALDEEAEALRIQKKQLQSMTEADFGFDEDEWAGQDGDAGADSGKVVTEVLPQLRITDDMSEEERLKILRTRYPEFEPISQEYLRLQPVHHELAAAANAATRLIKAHTSKSGKTNAALLPKPMAITKYRACAAYLAAMSMYFAVLGSTAQEGNSSVIALDPAELHEHPVMESLLKTRSLWEKVEGLPIGDPMVEAALGDELSVIEEVSVVETGNDLDVSAKEKKPKKTKAQRAAEAAQAKSEARRAEKLRQTEEELASLASLTGAKALKASRKKKAEEPKLNLLNAEDSDFGEETELTAHELAEKQKKKKSLRFYTSQIAQKAIRRDAAGKDAGGDADVPHRERLKDRQARLQAQAEKKGHNKSGPGVDLGEGGDSSDEGDAPPRPEDFEDGDGYYDMISARSNAKKQQKTDRAEAYAVAKAQGAAVVEEEIIGEDGRRQISYVIEKNKGLTPHRKKQNRNPRVKKKIRYEAKKKALKSQKPVFDAGKKAKGGAHYQGELTGIKKGLVRSRKL